MDTIKTGQIIKKRRIELGFTQKELSKLLFVEPKTISKWETGKGYPDLSNLPRLSEVLGLETSMLLKGELVKKERDSGNLRRMSFYLCPDCNNILWSTSSSSIFCCGNRLNPLKACNRELGVKISIVDNSYFLEIESPMTKNDHILFISFERDDTLFLKRLYPESSAETYIPRLMRGTLYIGKSSGELFVFKLRDTKEKLELSRRLN